MFTDNYFCKQILGFEVVNSHQPSIVVHHTYFGETAQSNQESEMLPVLNTIEVKTSFLLQAKTDLPRTLNYHETTKKILNSVFSEKPQLC